LDYECKADVRNFDGMVKDPIDQGIIALNSTFIEAAGGAMWGQHQARNNFQADVLDAVEQQLGPATQART
jgi:hypothetical protein